MRIKSLRETSLSRRKSEPSKNKAYFSFDKETQPLERSAQQSQGLLLDEHTLKDLEIFSITEEGRSLFEFCNKTRTEGGAKILRMRMELPWSDADGIQQTQDSVAYIAKHRNAFEILPSYSVQGVEAYQREILLMITQERPIEFFFAALSMRLNYDRHYVNIVRGVFLTCRMIRSLRRFLEQEELANPQGELQAIVAEMREIMVNENISKVPDDDMAGTKPRKLLRLDQTFRSHEKMAILRLMRLVYEIDALVSMADVGSENGFVMPQVLSGPLRMSAEDLYHPYLEAAVANSVELDQHQRVLFLTGPNMAGKTTYLRAIAIALYLGHLGMGVPARSFGFVPAQSLFSSISLNDDLHTGVSYFRAEALRVKAVATAIADGQKVIALMDEPFKGTNVKDAYDASLAILQRFATKQDCLFMFSSHLIELEDELGESPQILRRQFEAQEGEGRLRFDYKLRPGVSSQRLGVRILNEEGVFDLLK